MSNSIDYIGAQVSGDELDLMDFEERDAVEAAQGSTSEIRLLEDDLPERPGVIRHG